LRRLLEEGGAVKRIWQGGGKLILSPGGSVAGVQEVECSEVLKTVSRSQECTRRHESGLKCVYFNARNIKNKVDELGAWIGTWNYDVVAITETWIEQGQEWLLEVPRFMFW